MLIPLGSSTTFRLLLLKQFEDIKSEKMIFATALCVVLLSYSASFGDSLSLKNDTDLEKRTVIYLPPAPHFKRNPNDVVLRANKIMEEENVKAAEKTRSSRRPKWKNVLKITKKITKKKKGENYSEKIRNRKLKELNKKLKMVKKLKKKITPVKRK